METSPRSPATNARQVFPARALRDVAGCYVTGVAIVSTFDAGAQAIGVTVNSFTSLSLAPPLVMFNLDRRAFSLTAFLDAPHFAVHVLASGQQDLSDRFARAGGPKWEGIAYARDGVPAPVIAGCHAVLTCRRHSTHDGGDHIIFVGEVVEASLDEAVDPLGFYRGRYCGVAERPVI